MTIDRWTCFTSCPREVQVRHDHIAFDFPSLTHFASLYFSQTTCSRPPCAWQAGGIRRQKPHPSGTKLVIKSKQLRARLDTSASLSSSLARKVDPFDETAPLQVKTVLCLAALSGCLRLTRLRPSRFVFALLGHIFCLLEFQLGSHEDALPSRTCLHG
jgi:hypothetical protein